MFSPLCPKNIQACLREKLSVDPLEKFEKLFERARKESLDAAIAIMIVFIQSIDLEVVAGFVGRSGSFILKNSFPLFFSKSRKGEFAQFVLQLNFASPNRGTSILRLIFEECLTGQLSYETAWNLLDDLFIFNQQKQSDSMSALLLPLLSELLGFASRSPSPQQQGIVARVAQLLEFSNEDNHILRGTSDSDQYQNFSYFSGKKYQIERDEQFGPEMALADWETCLEDPTQADDQRIPQSSSDEELVMTPTTSKNILQVIDAAEAKTSLLLQGLSGVGKTSVIMEAGRLFGNKKTFRVNLSPHMEIEDLIGKLTLTKNGLVFVPHAFTVAFRDGHWLLLDELNLVRDHIFQALESAIDTRVLTLPESAVGDEFVSRTIKMHENFRVFATQNPNSGWFKNAREPLSTSFLDRFSILKFVELPATEWNEIIRSKLTKRGVDIANHISVDIVEHHVSLCQLFQDPSFPEKSSYSQLSIRELLKIVDHLVAHYRCKSYDDESTDVDSLINYEFWNVYGSRLRSRDGREKFFKYFFDNGINIRQFIAPEDWNLTRDIISIDGIRRNYSPSKTPVPCSQLSTHLTDKVLKIDGEVMNLIFSKEFILQHGVYLNGRSWVSLWFQSSTSETTEEQFLQIGCQLYLSKFVHHKAQQSILSIFKPYLNCDPSSNLSSHSFPPETSFTVTQSVLMIWKQLISVLSQDPRRPDSFLLAGRSGCGKRNCIRAFAALVGRPLEELCVMPETEASSFIGQYLPNEDPSTNHESRILWTNGAVTEAFLTGSWLLLDNFSQAEPSVLERLDPVLEKPPQLTLVEAGKSVPETLTPGFCLFATMTPPIPGGGEGQGSELSPALYNRMTVIWMENICETNDEKIFRDEILKICVNYLPESWNLENSNCRQSPCQILASISWMIHSTGILPAFNLRTICRMVEFALFISQSHPESTIATCIWSAFSITVAAQFPPSQKSKTDRLMDEIGEILKSFQLNWQPTLPLFLRQDVQLFVNGNEYVTTNSRKKYAEIMLACIHCQTSLLLEGPASTGKTTLVLALAQWMNKTVERVINTETTTIQDYFGSYLPNGNGFVFNKGPLYRAIEYGFWFLADEFDLADSSVMHPLVPLLERKNSVRIPETNIDIPVHPDFRFFATQNGSQSAQHQR
jgi:MoxR-like ATPase